MKITTILNCYRRPTNIDEQIKAIRSQNLESEIWVWKNYHDDNIFFDFNYDNIKVFNCNHNWKYCGRFAAACLVDTEYISILDDDTIPGNRWYENCLDTMETHRGILGGIGIKMYKEDSYEPHTRYGWASANDKVEEVDLVGHAWFFPAEYIKYMWMEKPMWDNGEDIHFSAMCQIHGGINTYVPPHPEGDKSLWSSLRGAELGIGPEASSAVRNHAVFYKQRDKCVQKMVRSGWKLCRYR